MIPRRTSNRSWIPCAFGAALVLAGAAASCSSPGGGTGGGGTSSAPGTSTTGAGGAGGGSTNGSGGATTTTTTSAAGTTGGGGAITTTTTGATTNGSGGATTTTNSGAGTTASGGAGAVDGGGACPEATSACPPTGTPCVEAVAGANGGCATSNAPAGTPCDDGMFCDGNGTCSGVCSCPTGNGCTWATCSMGTCGTMMAPAGATCGLPGFPTPAQVQCDGSGACLGFVAVVNGCGSGAVAWREQVPVSMHTWWTSALSMAGGHDGHFSLTFRTEGVLPDCYQSTTTVLDASGAQQAVPAVALVPDLLAAFDPEDRLLDAYSGTQPGVPAVAFAGFDGEGVSKKLTWTCSALLCSSCFQPQDDAPAVQVSFLGADAAGDLYVVADVTKGTGGAGEDFGLGPVSGTVLLHYDPSGALVSDDLPAAGLVAVGALGHLFYASRVTGTVDQGCGAVGAPSVTSTVLALRDAMGTCLYSTALPASVVLAFDPSEDVLIATTFTGTVDLGGGPLASVGLSDLALAKLDPSGQLLWSKSFGASGASVSAISAFGATTAGGATLAATLGGSVDFGCGAVCGTPLAGTLVATFDAMGTVVYSDVLAVGASAVSTRPVTDGVGGIAFAALAPLGSPQATVYVSRFAP